MSSSSSSSAIAGIVPSLDGLITARLSIVRSTITANLSASELSISKNSAFRTVDIKSFDVSPEEKKIIINEHQKTHEFEVKLPLVENTQSLENNNIIYPWSSPNDIKEIINIKSENKIVGEPVFTWWCVEKKCQRLNSGIRLTCNYCGGLPIWDRIVCPQCPNKIPLLDRTNRHVSGEFLNPFNVINCRFCGWNNPYAWTCPVCHLTNKPYVSKCLCGKYEAEHISIRANRLKISLPTPEIIGAE